MCSCVCRSFGHFSDGFDLQHIFLDVLLDVEGAVPALVFRQCNIKI
jgi:hypothetical protein